MRNLDKLNISKEQTDLLLVSEKQYKQYASILFDIIKIEDNSITVKVWQEWNNANKYLSQSELISRTKDMFSILDKKIHVHAKEYLAKDLVDMDIDVVRNKMKDHNLTQIALSKLLGIDTVSLNKLVTGDRQLTKIHKALFFYLFKTLDK